MTEHDETREKPRCLCRHPYEWHKRHGCYAIGPSGGCACKQYVVDLIDALRIGLTPQPDQEQR